MARSPFPPYFDPILEAWVPGGSSRHTHLGFWPLDQPARLSQPRAGDVFPRISTNEFEAARCRLNELMLELAGPFSGSAVLDIACGLGGLIQRLDQTVTDSELTGINIDPRQLEICQTLRTQRGNALRWQEADACRLPFDDNRFDTIFCVEAMFHFSSRPLFFSEACRVLKPGGILVGTDILMEAVNLYFPRFAVEAILSDGYGPWPDPWGSKGNSQQLLQGEVWADATVRCITEETKPSYGAILSDAIREDRDPGNPTERASGMLAWLHQTNKLRYEAFTARKAD